MLYEQDKTKFEVLLVIDVSQLAGLPVDEKLKIVTSLWDQIARDGQITLPDALLDGAEKRVGEMIADPEATISENEMWRQANDLR